MISASGAMRLMRPVRTRPGPISTKVVTPAAAIRSTARIQSTPAVRCSTSSVRHASAVSIGRASALARSGIAGSWNVDAGEGRAHARRPPRPSAGSGPRPRPAARWRAWRRAPWRARRRPRWPARSPETTTWPGALRLATTKTPCAEARGDQLGESGVVEADERGHRAVAALARTPASAGRARARAGRRPRVESAPAATRAEYWPIE